jgi:26S proteasome regulatory subunit N4
LVIDSSSYSTPVAVHKVATRSSAHPSNMSTLVHHTQHLPQRHYTPNRSLQHQQQQHQKLSLLRHNNINTPETSHASTQNWVTAYSSPLTPSTDFDFANSANYIPSTQRSLYDFSASESSQNLNNLRIQVQTPFASSSDPELMQSDHSVAPSSWNFTNGQLTPTSARSHYRESSLSSLGSAGPSSPYTSSTSHPHVILPSDSVGEQQYYEPIADQTTYQTFSKPLTPHTPSHDNNYITSSFHGLQYHNDPNYSHIMAMQRHHDDESMPVLGHSGRPSVASTHESPATPAAGDDFEEHSRKTGESALINGGKWMAEYLPLFDATDFRNTSTMPKLDRTMSDAYNDELYNPNLVYSAPTSKPTENKMLSNAHSDIFSQRLQAANSQHLSASTHSPVMDQARGQRSPFRQGSPLAPTSNGFGSPQSLGSAAKIRELRKAQDDARVLAQQLSRRSPGQVTPKTISPKDALLDYHETEEDSAMPLFPPQKTPQQYRLQSHANLEQSQPDFSDTASQQSYGSMATSRRESSSAYSTTSQATQQQSSYQFAPPSVPGGLNIPQQYPFVPQRRQPSNLSNFTERSPEFPSTLTSMESSSSEADLKKPAGATANGGTYSCTYHNCTLRFETPSALQKHKREGHRSSQPLIGGVRSGSSEDNGMSAEALRNSQAGPHKCERINPSTGKPCNVIFSRPYDLTRHEQTIHDARKQKVRCQYCTEEKTFSRADALTRHMRVVHPEIIDYPGAKPRRRGN